MSFQEYTVIAMHRLVNGKVVIGLTVSAGVLLIVCLVLLSALLSRSRFERTRQFGVMFDTKTARLCDADGALSDADSFKRFVDARRSAQTTRPYCSDLK